MAKGKTDGSLGLLVETMASSEEGLTSAQICTVYQATLADFVGGKTNRKSVSEIIKLLAGALAARKQMLAERDSLTSQRCHQFFYNNN